MASRAKTTSENIRKIEPQDATLIREFYLKFLDDSFQQLPKAALEAYKNDWTESIICQRCSQTERIILGCFDDYNTPIGVALGTPPEGGVGTIIWLAVDKAFHKRGTGRRLMQATVDAYKATGCHKIKLFAPTEQAVNFYRHIGMNLEGTHPNHWWGHTFWSLGLNI